MIEQVQKLSKSLILPYSYHSSSFLTLIEAHCLRKHVAEGYFQCTVSPKLHLCESSTSHVMPFYQDKDSRVHCPQQSHISPVLLWPSLYWQGLWQEAEQICCSQVDGLIFVAVPSSVGSRLCHRCGYGRTPLFSGTLKIMLPR